MPYRHEEIWANYLPNLVDGMRPLHINALREIGCNLLYSISKARTKITTMRITFCLLSVCAFTASAQLAVTVSPPKIVGQKAIIPLAITNNLAEGVESARALCFLLDAQGKMVGQSAKWVVGGTKDLPALEPKTGTTFNFVITSPQPFTATNLTARITFSRVILASGQQANPRTDVQVQYGN